MDSQNDLLDEMSKNIPKRKFSKIGLFFGFMYVCTAWKSIEIIVWIVKHIVKLFI